VITSTALTRPFLQHRYGMRPWCTNMHVCVSSFVRLYTFHTTQVLFRVTMLRSLRDVGLHVWDSSDTITTFEHDFLLITAPLSVLAARAETLRMRVRVRPFDSSGMYHGHFHVRNFVRGGPMLPYRVATFVNPHPCVTCSS